MIKDIANPVLKEIKFPLSALQLMWIPTLLAIGIGFYFSLTNEPTPYTAPSLCLLGLLSGITLRKYKTLLIICIILCITSIGFSLAQYRTWSRQSPALAKSSGVRHITGRANDIHYKPYGIQLILDQLTIEGLKAEETPKRLRLSIRTADNGVSIPDYVSLDAVLEPVSQPIVPGSYDFARHAWFQQIGATGFSVTPITIEQKSSASFIKRLRQSIIITANQLEQPYGAIASALLVGEQSNIPKDIQTNIQNAGLSHLLAVSGMHLVLVNTLCFAFIRYTLSFSQTIALRFNTKKIAALFSIIIGLIYLPVTGSPISAERACIMTTLVLLAILLDRTSMSMRALAISAIIVLSFQPESLLTPSFQMSYAAVIALIATFEHYKPFFAEFAEYRFFRKLWLYIAGTTLSSIVAGLATAPFTLYHFNQISPYGLFANLLAIPLTSFWIMPWGLLSVLLIPAGLDAFTLVPMQWGIILLVQIATWFGGLPYAGTHIPSLELAGLLAITSGALWLCIIPTKLSRLGIIPIGLGILYGNPALIPDIFIDSKSLSFALRNSRNEWVLSETPMPKFTKETLEQRLGTSVTKTTKETEDPFISCDTLGCLYTKHKKTIALVTHPMALTEDCKVSNWLVNLTYIKSYCNKATLNTWDLHQHGSYFLYVNDTITVKYSTMGKEQRPWR